ncbi:MAG: hypothetical protein IJ083_07105 [Clostridia bacterium]|nr:hypothetical protein [Clostridia bacterium]
MKCMIARVLVPLLTLLLLFSLAFADTQKAEVIEMQDGKYVKTESDYIRLSMEFEGEAALSLEIRNSKGQLTYQKDLGTWEDSFLSESIYLKSEDTASVYDITVWAGNQACSIRVEKVLPHVHQQRACAIGLPVSSMKKTQSWQSVTFLDLRDPSVYPLRFPLHASGSFTLGEAVFELKKGKLTVHVDFLAESDCTIEKSAVQIALTSVDALAFDTKSFHGLKGNLDKAVDVSAASIVCVYLPLTVSYLPESLPASPDSIECPGQMQLWKELQEITDSQSNG